MVKDNRSRLRDLGVSQRNREKAIIQYRDNLISYLTHKLGIPEQGGPFVDPYVSFSLEEIGGEKREGPKVTVEQALQQKNHVVILGSPGTGKTALLHFIGILSARGIFQNLPNLPVLIQLGTVPAFSTLEGAVQAEIHHHMTARLSRQDVLSLLDRGRLLLLLDGLDEAANSEDVARQILDFASVYSHTRIVVSTRSTFEEQLPGFARFRLSALAERDVRTLVDSWCPAFQISAEMFWVALCDNPSLLSLAKNPSMLKLMLNVYQRQGKLPIRSGDLAESAMTILFPRSYEGLPSRIRKLVERIAFYMSDRKQTTIGLHEIEERFGSKLPYGPEATDPQKDLEALVTVGVLERPRPGQCRFSHQLFQEYLAAACLKSLDTQQLLTFAEQRLGDRLWESILMIVMRSRADTATIIARFLESEDPGGRIFAGKLVAEGSRVDSSTYLRTTRSLCDLLEQLGPEQVLDISNVLAKIGDDDLGNVCLQKLGKWPANSLSAASLAYVLAVLGKDERLAYDIAARTIRDDDPFVRYQSCRALSVIGTSEAIELLIQHLRNEHDNRVVDQILSGLHQQADLQRYVSSSVLAILLAELEHRSSGTGDPEIKDRARYLVCELINEISSAEV